MYFGSHLIKIHPLHYDHEKHTVKCVLVHGIDQEAEIKNITDQLVFSSFLF